MTIGIIGMNNLYLMPYLYYYTKVLDDNYLEYEVIYWDRELLNEKAEFNTIAYNSVINTSHNLAFKLINYYHYSIFIREQLKNKKYDYLIILGQNITPFIAKQLFRQYSEKFIIDVRDYFNYNKLFGNKFKCILKKSDGVVISSPDFIKFLSAEEFILSHNCSNEVIRSESIGFDKQKNKNYPIRIAFVGLIRFKEQCINFINQIKDDTRIEFHFYGTGIEEGIIKNFCHESKINNVIFHGRYNPEDKHEIYKKIDLIFNAYGNENPGVIYALSNKFYEAAIYKIPILVSPKTSMEKYSKGLGLAIDIKDPEISDKICKWYSQLNWFKLNEDAEEILNMVEFDNRRFKEIMKLKFFINYKGDNDV